MDIETIVTIRNISYLMNIENLISIRNIPYLMYIENQDITSGNRSKLRVVYLFTLNQHNKTIYHPILNLHEKSYRRKRES